MRTTVAGSTAWTRAAAAGRRARADHDPEAAARLDDTAASSPADVREAVEAFLSEHPEPHVAAWAGKAGAVEVE